VYLYPKWYLTPALGWNGVREDLAPLITRADGTREYRVSDHLASLRWRLIGDTTTQTYDYTPWGDIQSGGPASASDRTFNEQEKDGENGLFDLGVRKYEVETGRFGSVDPLWEGLRSRTLYGYADQNPVLLTDPGGNQAEAVLDIAKEAYRTAVAPGMLKANVDKASERVGFMAAGPLTKIRVGTREISFGVLPRSAHSDTEERVRHGQIVDQLVNGPLDAVRHAWAAAMTARDVGGVKTVTLLAAYEDYEQLVLGHSDAACDMDRFNNMVGVSIGMANTDASDDRLFELVMSALADGKLLISPPRAR